ncbi:MAG: hypothetical protein H6559_29820 [Lewinellaceae bacterium]|nr:hypothetical protein [Lewinellaceae bacterium]
MLDPIRHIDPSSIKDIDTFRDIVKLLLNIVEQQSDQIEQLRQENQELKDEINRLKENITYLSFLMLKTGKAKMSRPKNSGVKEPQKGKRNLKLKLTGLNIAGWTKRFCY